MVGAHIYKVGGRVFAVLGVGPADALSVKVSEIAYEALTHGRRGAGAG